MPEGGLARGSTGEAGPSGALPAAATGAAGEGAAGPWAAPAAGHPGPDRPAGFASPSETPRPGTFLEGAAGVPERPTVCVDLDSTLCDTRHRRHMIRAADDPVPMDWRAYSLACTDDAPIEGPITLLRLLAPACRIVILSARDEAARGLTERWLREHEVPYDRLILYRPGVDDPDMGTFKAEQVRRLRAEGAEVALMVEDAPLVAASMRDVGVATLLVQPPVADDSGGRPPPSP